MNLPDKIKKQIITEISRRERFSPSEILGQLNKAVPPEASIDLLKLQGLSDRLYELKCGLPKQKKKVAESCIQNLMALIPEVEDSKGKPLHMDWDCTPYGIVVEPNINICSRVLGIVPSMYIDQDYTREFIQVDYTGLLEAVALEAVHRDLGYTTDDIFRELGSDVLEVLPRTVLDKYIKGIMFISRVRSMQIQDSLYAPKGKDTVYTYFYTELPRAKTYNSLILCSNAQILAKIYKSRIDKLQLQGVRGTKLYGISDGLILYSIRADKVREALEVLTQPIDIQVFGHKIRCTPKVQQSVNPF